MSTPAQDYLAKAHENLASAENELAQQRLNSCARSAYYACFHAAIAALVEAGLITPEPADGWKHDWVQASFSEQFIQRRKLFAGSMRRVLPTLLDIRHTADYRVASVSQREARQVMRHARAFVEAITAHLSSEGDRR